MKQMQMLLALLAALVLLGLMSLGGYQVFQWRAAAMQNEARGRTMTATEGILSDAAKSDADRTGVENRVASGRAQYDKTMSEAENNDEATHDWRNAPVPDSVRRAAHERRLTRERSASDGGKSGEGR
jgi:hypothetical protein